MPSRLDSFLNSRKRPGRKAGAYRALLDMANITPDDWYRLVPKSLLENAHYRQFLLQEAHSNKDLQKLLRKICSQSPLFWINSFIWGLDPRDVNAGAMTPFVTFHCQDVAISTINRCIYPPPGSKQSDVLIQKSRDMGATWICCLLALHSWQFNEDRHDIFTLSWKKELVDGGDKSIFGKIDLALEIQPNWLLPEGFNKRCRSDCNLYNPQTQATITGEGTSGKAGTGGRFRFGFFDEFPMVEHAEEVYIKSRDTTNCRIFNGTHKGNHTEFYRLSKHTKIVQVRLHWSDHPWKAEGLYTGSDGKLRSPWYDLECEVRGYNRKAIAQELDIDPTGSGDIFFDGAEINRLIELYAREPSYKGELHKRIFGNIPPYRLLLWCKLDANGLPPVGSYGIGCDVAEGVQGSSSTPSCASVVNLLTGEKVGQFVSRDLPPEAFADYVTDLARWFHMASVNWEDRGPGLRFKKQMMEVRGYTHVYIQPKKNYRVAWGKPAETFGFNITQENKRYMLTAYRAALSTGRFLNHSKEALEETLQYIYDKEKVTHSGEFRKNDPLQLGINHGDLVVADALANLFLDDKLRADDDSDYGPALDAEGHSRINPPYGCMAWREMMARREEDEDANDGW